PGPIHEHLAARARHDVGKFLASEAGVDGNRYGTEVGASEKSGEPGGNVGQPQGNAIAGGYAELRKARSQAPALVCNLRIRDQAVAIDEAGRGDACASRKQCGK